MDQAVRGSAALEAGNYAEAIQHFTHALALNPRAVNYFISRSTAYQRIAPANYEAALRDADVAVALAYERGRRELIAKAQFRRAIGLFGLGRYADAEKIFAQARKFNDKEPGLEIWEKKVRQKLDQLSSGDGGTEATVDDIPAIPEDLRGPGKPTEPVETSPFSVAKPPASPAKEEMKPTSARHEWFQNAEKVFLTIFAKGLTVNDVHTEMHENSLSVSLPLRHGATYDLTFDPLYAAIDPAKSTVSVSKSKIEIHLQKERAGLKWRSLEGDAAVIETNDRDSTVKEAQPDPDAKMTPTLASATAYPTSSRTGPKDWDKVAKDLMRSKTANTDGKEEEDNGSDDDADPVNGFFKKLYAGADPDTRRAMIKSYQESNGTALSTNWTEVKKKPVETRPPEGLEAKKWAS